MLYSPILNENYLQTCLMSFAFILTLVIMTRMTLDHFANDPLATQGEKILLWVKLDLPLCFFPSLGFMPSKLELPMPLPLRAYTY